MSNSRPTKRVDPAGDGGDLDDLRRQIDDVDSAILRLLNDRARLVQSVGALKEARNAPVYAPDRERQIVDRLAGENLGPFPNRGLAPVFREIVAATRSLEAEPPIAFFGPEGTFTHQAAKERFGELAPLMGLPSITDVFANVEKGKAGIGVVPVENTTAGVVTETLDAFAESDISICGEIVLRISLDLFSRSGRIEDVERLVSHPQPLAQCRRWLDQHLPQVERVEAASTAAAVKLASEDPAVAAIGSSTAGEAFGLVTVESAIQDRRENTTRFLILGRQHPEATGNDLTSALFTIRKDEAGGLFRLIEPMANRGVNLTSIHLRPIAGKPWEYYFFVDIEGHQSDPQVAAALADACDVAHTTRILGSFPRATTALSGAREM